MEEEAARLHFDELLGDLAGFGDVAQHHVLWVGFEAAEIVWNVLAVVFLVLFQFIFVVVDLYRFILKIFLFCNKYFL